MLVLLENDLCFGFNVKKCGVKEDFSYTDWKKKVLLDNLKNPPIITLDKWGIYLLCIVQLRHFLMISSLMPFSFIFSATVCL